MNPLCIFGPLLLPWLLLGWSRGISLWQACLLSLGGFLLWTFAEYAVHRWIIHQHWRPGRWATAVAAVQHESPDDPQYLSLKGTIPAYLAVFGILYLVTWNVMVAGFILCGVSVGYIAYEFVHQVCHGPWPRHPVLRYLKRNHLIHHYSETSCGFSMILPLWDILLGTQPTGPLPESFGDPGKV